jgi:hypothetical protein
MTLKAFSSSGKRPSPMHASPHFRKTCTWDSRRLDDFTPVEQHVTFGRFRRTLPRKDTYPQDDFKVVYSGNIVHVDPIKCILEGDGIRCVPS